MTNMTSGLAVLALGGLAFLPGCTQHDRNAAYQSLRDTARGRQERPRDSRIDLNAASQASLAQLPGMSDADAARIVANRPYGQVSGLRSKNVLGQRKYEGVRNYVYVTK
jgi:competence protein ComEA